MAQYKSSSVEHSPVCDCCGEEYESWDWSDDIFEYTCKSCADSISTRHFDDYADDPDMDMED